MIAADIIRLSPNLYDKPVKGRTVIIHATRSGESMNPSEFEGTLNYMSEPGNNSSHFVLSREAELALTVPVFKQAWHAGEDNDNSWGIELEQGAEVDGFTDAQLKKLVLLSRSFMSDFDVPPIHAETSLEAGFIGHQETAQGRRFGKSDPGRLFPWEWFIQQLKGGEVQPARQEGNFVFIYNNDVPIRRYGSDTMPERVGREAWNFGGQWLWVRHFQEDGTFTAWSYLSEIEGD